MFVKKGDYELQCGDQNMIISDKPIQKEQTNSIELKYAIYKNLDQSVKSKITATDDVAQNETYGKYMEKYGKNESYKRYYEWAELDEGKKILAKNDESDPDRYVFWIEKGTDFICYLMIRVYKDDPNTAFLESVFTLEPHRRNGYMTHLIQFALKTMKAMDEKIKTIKLELDPSKRSSVELYKKMGFKKEKEYNHYYFDKIELHYIEL
jgi:ribosomal protein S18 acetylase RimI-like enzyme